MKYVITVFSIIVVSMLARGVYSSGSPGDELLGTWELAEKICDRTGKKKLRKDYTTDSSDMISALHFKTPSSGLLEEIHLAKGRACNGKAEFRIDFLEKDQMKLTQNGMIWNGHSRRVLANLGCVGNGRSSTIMGYSYDKKTDTLKLRQKDPSRVCSSLLSIYKRK